MSPPNPAVEQTAGSHSLATAAHRDRSTHQRAPQGHRAAGRWRIV